jgi:hypothetical protein
MSDEERGDGNLERYNSTRVESVGDESTRINSIEESDRIDAVENSGRIDSVGSSRSPTRDSREAEPPDSIADAVSGSLSRTQSVTVESDSASATLVGVPTVDIEEFVFGHQQGSHSQRSVALFDVQNKSEQPLRWQSTRTQFIGDDEYTYSPSRQSLDPETLGPGCHTRQVQLPPGKRARVVTLVEELPPGVEVVEVVQTLSAGVGTAGNERLVFSL